MLCQEALGKSDANSTWPAAICGQDKTFLSKIEPVIHCRDRLNWIRTVALPSFISEPLIHLVLGDQGLDLPELKRKMF